jgi:hypothetical protein
MKKIMLIAAAAAGLVAIADGVASGIVGYNQITIKKGWNMLAVNYDATADDNGIALQDLFPGEANGLKGGTNTGSADYLNVWENGDYTTYFLYYTTKGGNTSKNWKWVNGSGVPASAAQVGLGGGTWYYHRGTGFDLSIDRPYTVE